MRRCRLPRILSSALLALCCLFVLTLHATFRTKLRFDFFRHEIPPSALHEQQIPVLFPDRPWFMRGGVIRPPDPRISDAPPRLWPHESGDDRIVNQLMYSSPDHNASLKKILLFFGRRGWSDLPMGRTVFRRDRCPVHACEISVDRKQPADLVLFKDRYSPLSQNKLVRTPDQIWLLFLLECPLHTQSFNGAAGLFNWTASYRHDSDIVAPYEKWVPFPSTGKGNPRNYAAGKTGKVVWFVSNCAARNRRLQYARELSRHIEVDQFGKCGGPTAHKCPKSSSNRCFRMLNREYKFYLAFENSNCKDYVTEKFFINGLGHDVIPIVMGARPEDYARVSPPHSYIHVEDFSGPAHLARYLHELDSNDTLYNSYFQWKGTGEFINTRFWCRLCALLHAPVVPKVYTDLETWWAGRGTCTADEWRKKDTSSDPPP